MCFLKVGSKYKISLHNLDSFNATLLRVPNRSNTHYDWQRDNGTTFSNRKEDIDLWIKKNYIKLAL